MTPARYRIARAPGRAWPVALVILAFALRVFRLGDQNVWWDEGLAIWAVRKPLVDATLWTAGDVHPPLYFWLLWGWVRLVGQSELAARAMTAGFGVLAVAVAYATGRRVGGRSTGAAAGVLAALFVGLSRFEVWWSTEMRMYALAGLAVALLVYAAVRWGAELGGDGRRRWLAAYVIAAAAALYTVYLTGAAIAAVNLAMVPALAARRAGGRSGSGAPGGADSVAPGAPVQAGAIGVLGEWLLAQAAVMLAFAPWLVVALPRMQSWTSITGASAAPSFVAQLWATLIATGVSTDLASVAGWTYLFWASALAAPVALAIVSRVRRRASDRRTARVAEDRHERLAGGPNQRGAGPWSVSWAGGWADRVAALTLTLFVFVPPAVVWAATQPRALFYSPAVEARYLVPFAAPVYVLAAWCVAGALTRAPRLGAVLLIGAFAPLIALLPGHYAGRRLQDLHQTMVLTIWSQAEAGDAVLLLSGNRYPLFLYHYDQPWVQPALATELEYPADNPPEWAERPPVIPFPDLATAPIADHDWQAALGEIMSRHDRIWLAEVESHLQDPDGQVRAWLGERWPLVLSESYGPDALHLFAADGDAPVMHALSRRFPGTVDTRFLPVEADRATELLPVAGMPARRALAGDSPNVTLFAAAPGATPGTVAPVGEPDDYTLDAGPPVPGAVALDAFPAWSRGLQEWPPPGGRVRMALKVSDRTPSGAGPVILSAHVGDEWLTVAALPAISVIGSAPPGGGELIQDADFGFVALRAASVEPTTARPGETIRVDLRFEWPNAATDPDDVNGTAVSEDPRARVPLPEPSIFVHLVGTPRPAGGDPTWAVGQDGAPSSGGWLERAPTGTIFDRQLLAVPSGAPPGEYTVVVGMYDPASGERLTVDGPAVDAGGTSVTVGLVSVR